MPLWYELAPLVGLLLLPKFEVSLPPEIGLIYVGGIFVPLAGDSLSKIALENDLTIEKLVASRRKSV
mgnify:CR=1 FL=1